MPGDEVAEGASNGLIAVPRGVLVRNGAAEEEWPIRCISSRVLAPVAAARVLAVCRRSWKCRPSMPVARTAALQFEEKLPRRSMAPLGPQKTRPSGPIATGPSETRLELEDRGLEALGDQAKEIRGIFDTPGVWLGLPERFSGALG